VKEIENKTKNTLGSRHSKRESGKTCKSKRSQGTLGGGFERVFEKENDVYKEEGMSNDCETKALTVPKKK